MTTVPPGLPSWVASPQNLRVTSDASLVASVGHVPPTPGWPPPKPLNPVALPPQGSTASVMELLRLLSIRYSPPGRTPFWPTARWGLLRYFWAFDSPSAAGLRLSSTVATLPTRLKGLLAEDLGVAICHQVIPDLVPMPQGASTSWIDGDLALGGTAVGPYGLTALANRNAGPDYYFVVASGPTVTPYAVEAKGTTGTAWVRQMRHAARQLSSVQLAAPGGSRVSPHGIAVSSDLKPTQIHVRVLDPKGDWSGPAGPRRESETPAEHRVTTLEDGVTTVSDPEAFRRDLLDLGSAQLLGYAGQSQRATIRLPSRARSAPADAASADAPLREEHTELGVFDGISVRGRLPQGLDLEAFYGVEREILGTLDDEDLSTVADARSTWIRRVRSLDEQPFRAGVADDAPAFDSVGRDGTLLRVRIYDRRGDEVAG